MSTTVIDPVIDEGALRATLAGSERPAHPTPLAASAAFTWRALLKIKHVPMQLFDVTAFPIMFTLLFTYLFGGALEGSTQQYIQFLLPGILVLSVTWITMYTGMALKTDLSKGVFDRFRSLPIWRPAVLVGMLTADAIRYALASIVILVLGLIIGFRPDGGALGVLAAIGLVLLFSFSLSWAWTAMAFRVKTPESVLQLAMSVLFPLAFASNVFVDPSTMPGWVQAFVDVNPITHLVDAARGLMQGGAAGEPSLYVLLWSAGLLAVFGPLTMRQYNRDT